MERYLCIHGHFYQPPRENPWLEDVEQQDSAYPFHDWNERVTSECYGPNAASRILDWDGNILDIVNNYSRISFNFGPTLLSWMEKHAPAPYRSILEADRRSRELFSGHGSAMAQCYNHMIMPLATPRDKRTQVIWGIRDFQHRFGRRPEGMWLPETAVDLESLDLMAEQGIKFTVLSPYQAHRVRSIRREAWHNVSGGHIDPRRPYTCHLPSGRSIALFFYDGHVAQEVAFSRLLDRGEHFAGRLIGTFSHDPHPQLAHIATDGETYGHHRRFGDMALAYCLKHVEERGLARLTVYGEFLKKHPPEWAVEIWENTSWSCAHGIERWRSDCGCRIGGDHWHQKWRAPVREALDWLAGEMAPLFEREMERLSCDPWQARDDYIEVILDRSPERVRDFLQRHCGRDLSSKETVTALRLLEMQRHAMLMYTSCGWFFDEVSGIESTQSLAYAARALQLAQVLGGGDLEPEFLRRLEKAPSNLPRWENGARVYEELVRAGRIDLMRVAAHQAIASLFEEEKEGTIYCYTTEHQSQHRIRGGPMQFATGRTRIRSEVTWKVDEFDYAVLYLGAQNVTAGVRPSMDEERFEKVQDGLREAFERSDIPGTIRLMDEHFGEQTFTLWHLFRDEQRKVLRQIMAPTLQEIHNSFRGIYNNHLTLVRFLHGIGMPIPPELARPVEIALKGELGRILRDDEPSLEGIRRLSEEMRKMGVTLEQSGLARLAGLRLLERVERLADDPDDLPLLLYLNTFLDLFRELPLDIDLWQAQNTYFALYRPSLSRLSEDSLDPFLDLGRKLRIKVD